MNASPIFTSSSAVVGHVVQQLNGDVAKMSDKVVGDFWADFETGLKEHFQHNKSLSGDTAVNAARVQLKTMNEAFLTGQPVSQGTLFGQLRANLSHASPNPAPTGRPQSEQRQRQTTPSGTSGPASAPIDTTLKAGNWVARNFATNRAEFKNIYTTDGTLNKGRIAIAATGTAVGLGVSYHFLKKAAKGTKVNAETGLEEPMSFVQRTGSVVAGLGGLVVAGGALTCKGQGR